MIHFDNATGVLTLETKHSSYQMQIDELGFLNHQYYGRRIPAQDLSYIHRHYDRGFSGNPYDCGERRGFSLDTLCQEYSSAGVGDYRVPSIGVRAADGSRCADLRYVNHKITAGKYSLHGLPAAWDPDGDAETLTVTLRDPVTGLTAELYYGVFAEKDVITRAALLRNEGEAPMELEKAGFDQMPCTSNWAEDASADAVVKYCKEHIDPSRLKGFCMAPWAMSIPDTADKVHFSKVLRGLDLMGAARHRYYSK